jgi:hypothetical protein
MLSSAPRPAGRYRAATVSRRVIELTAFVRSFVAVMRAPPRDERFHENVLIVHPPNRLTFPWRMIYWPVVSSLEQNFHTHWQ